MPETSIKNYRPSHFVPTTSFTGGEVPILFRGENMWIRIGRFGSIYAEGYSGNLDLGETIPTKTLTGTLAWDSTTKVVTGTGTLFITELHLGSFVLGDGGANQTELLVVEKIVSNTSIVISRKPTTTLSGKTGYVLPVLFPIGTDRGSAIRGNVVQSIKGHYLGVGDGTFRVNGATLSSSLTLTRKPTFALYDPVTGTYTINEVGIEKMTTPVTLTAITRLTITGATAATPISITSAAHGLATGTKVNIEGIIGVPEANGTFIITNTGANTFTLNGTTGTGAYVSGGFVWPSVMRAGSYNIRVCRSNSMTLGFSQPTDVIEPITLTANQSVKVTFNLAMVSDQDAYDIYSSQFLDNSTTTIEARYQGPWYKVKQVKASDLIDGSHATGRETGTSHVFSFADSELSEGQEAVLLSFDNNIPVDCEFLDITNGIPIYFSAQGKGTTSSSSTSPGPTAIPSKPSNPEAIFLNKAFTMAGGDYIIGAFNAKSRLFALGQNTLQNVVLTTVDVEPIAFRSLWNSGFRNPYNMAFVKEYLYAHSTQGLVRSVAGGDDTSIEFEYATDVRDYVINFECGHELTAHDPKNKAVCHFYSARERRNGYWITLVVPFMYEKGIWGLPIVLSKTNTDFIVSGVATVGNTLTFLAGGRNSGGSIEVKTYEFDGGDSETKSWYMAWPYSDDEMDIKNKRIKGSVITGRFANNTDIKLFGVAPEGEFKYTDIEAGTNADDTTTIASTAGSIKRSKFVLSESNPFMLYSMRVGGSYTNTVDRFDELSIVVEENSSEM